MLRLRLLSTATALVLALLLMTGLSGVARADTILIANLTNAQENPPVVPTASTGGSRPASFGTAVFSLNDAQTAMMMFVSISNIDVNGTQTPNDTNDNLANAHIHAPAPPGMNASVVWGFWGAPQNTANDIMMVPFQSGVGGIFTATWNLNEGNAGQTLTSQLGNILGGQAYINFHTAQFPGGEIRGQIQLVPEASSLLLLLTGLAGAAGFSRRRISLS